MRPGCLDDAVPVVALGAGPYDVDVRVDADDPAVMPTMSAVTVERRRPASTPMTVLRTTGLHLLEHFPIDLARDRTETQAAHGRPSHPRARFLGLTSCVHPPAGLPRNSAGSSNPRAACALSQRAKTPYLSLSGIDPRLWLPSRLRERDRVAKANQLGIAESVSCVVCHLRDEPHIALNVPFGSVDTIQARIPR